MIPELKVIGIDPGGTTGWCVLYVPRGCIYNPRRHPSQIAEIKYGEYGGDEVEQAKQISALARVTQGLDYKVGPAMVIEKWDQDPTFKSTDPEALSPVRIGAMLQYAKGRGELHDARIVFQSRALAKETFTDDRLKHFKMYVAGSAHIRDAIRHALTALRRAKADKSFRDLMWFDDN